MKLMGKLGVTAMGGVLVLAACGGDSNGPGTSTTLDQAQADVIGGIAAEQVGAIAGALGNYQVSGAGLSQGFFAAGAPGARMMTIARRVGGSRARAAGLLVDPPTGCTPSVVGDSSDTDGDGIPNNATFTFTTANCTVVDTVSGSTASVTGTVAFQDTDDNDTFFGYSVGFGQWRYTLTSGGSSAFIQLNGTTAADVGTGAVSGNDHYAVTVGAGSDNLTVSQNWDAAYTPDPGEVVDPGAPSLPAGSFAINGNFGFSGQSQGQSGAWSFGLTTTNALAFDPSCGDINQLTAGSIQGVISANTAVGFTIDLQGCGVTPTVTVFGVP
jgi:hypothetical protein